MAKKFLTLAALAFALAAVCGAEARAQRVGPVEDDRHASSNGSPARDDKKRDAAKSAAAKEPAAPVKSEAKPDAKTGDKTETKKDAKSPEAKSDAKPAGAKAGEAQQAAASLGAPAAQGEKAASDGAKAAGQPAAGINSFGSVPAAPKYEPPPPIKADPSAASNNAASASAAPPAAPAPPPTSVYRVGVGDILDIRLVGGVGREATLFTVLSNGTIDYPMAGEPVLAANLLPEEIGARLSAALKRRGIFDRAQFQVSVREYVSHTVLVSGLVDQPGQKILRREAVPLYVVMAESFPRAEAGRVVVISRATGRTKTLDLADSNSLSELVSHGDVINVQPRPREFYYIGGQIGSPGQKDFTPGITLTQAILASGGLARADKKLRVAVSRQAADGRLVTTEYALSEVEAGVIPDPRIQPGDRIEVGRRR